MKYIILISVSICFSFFCIAQSPNTLKYNFEIVAIPALKISGGSTYMGIDFSTGILHLTNRGDIKINVDYRLSGSSIFSFGMLRHLLGGTFEYHLPSPKRYNFFFRLSALTEIATNYKDKLIREGDLFPTPKQYLIEKHLNGYPLYHDYWYFYQSTPFEGDLMFGMNFSITNSLKFCLALGYEINILKMKYGYFDPELPNQDISHFANKTITNQMIAFQIGLNYSFHFKKQINPKVK